MILRGIQIQRHGHGKCGLLSDRTLSSSLAELQSSGVLTLIRMSECDSNIFSSPLQHWEFQYVLGWNDRKPIHVSRSRWRKVRRPRAELPDSERRLVCRTASTSST